MVEPDFTKDVAHHEVKVTWLGHAVSLVVLWVCPCCVSRDGHGQCVHRISRSDAAYIYIHEL